MSLETQSSKIFAKITKQPAYVFLAFAAIITLGQWYPNLTAKWGVVDDHEVPYYSAILDSQNEASSGFAETLISKTEVGQPFKSSRYRPGYYFLRLSEASIWGTSPLKWYLFRLIVFFLFSFLVLLTLSEFVPMGWAILISFFGLTHVSWAGIMARAATSEFYIMFGLIFLIPSYLFLLKKNKHQTLSCIGILLGTLIAAGSKENMIILALPAAYAFLTVIRQKRHWLGLPLIIAISYCGFIGASVALPTLSHGTDIYAQSTSVSSRMGTVLVNKYFYIFVSGLAGLAFLWIRQGLRWSSTKVLVPTVGLLLLYLYQLFFYNGNFPSGMRYDFPAHFVWVCLIVLLVSALRSSSHKTQRWTLVLIALFMIFKIADGWKHSHKRAIRNSLMTNDFSSSISSLKTKLYDFPNSSLVFEIRRAESDYEPFISIERFIHSSVLSRDLLLRLEYDPKSNNNLPPLEKKLREHLKTITKRTGDLKFKPFTSENTDAINCISILLNRESGAYCHVKEIIRW